MGWSDDPHHQGMVFHYIPVIFPLVQKKNVSNFINQKKTIMKFMAIINRYVHKPWHKPCHKPSPKFEVYWIGPPQWDDENPTPHLWPVGWDGLLLGLQKRNWTWEYITISELCIYFFFSHEALSCCHVYLYIYVY